MENEYYIELIASAGQSRKWNFKTRESRNTIYDKVHQKFESEKASRVPYIEVEIGDESSDYPTMQMPLRLKVENKDEVIKYIDSLI